eukprot:gene10940-12101_t
MAISSLKLKLNGSVLFVTAHPDDESMFFAPSILHSLRHLGRNNVYVLCLTTGDYYGQGRVRAKEIIEACDSLGMRNNNVFICDNVAFKDGMSDWDTNKVECEIRRIVKDYNIMNIVTFDSYGISGHHDHIKISEALKSAKRIDMCDLKPNLYTLESVNILRKYISVFDLVYSVLDGLLLTNFGSTDKSLVMLEWSDFVPRRKCTIEKPKELKTEKRAKDSICLELGSKCTKTYNTQKDIYLSSGDVVEEDARPDDVQCKRKLDFFNGTGGSGCDVKQVDENANQMESDGMELMTMESTNPESSEIAHSPTSESKMLALEQTPSIALKDGTGSVDFSSKNTFRIRDLVFGKLKGYDWWPGLLITYREARQRPPLENCYWIRWFGDHKVSEVLNVNLDSLFEFKTRFTPNRMRGVYKKGISEALELAAKRSSKIGLPVGGTKEAEDKRLETLIQWALDSFDPIGKEGLNPKELDEEESSSSDEEEEGVNKKPKLDRHKDHPVKFYRSDDKDRFGKPLTNPVLAETVKGLFDEVVEGKRSIEGLCLGCGDTKIVIQHPLFHGGLCEECKEAFVEGAYLFDADGSQMYCSICSDGKEVLMCDSPGCCRSYCGVCIDMLCGVGAAVKIASEDKWICFMCSGESVRLLKRREDWQDRLREIFMSDDEEEYPPLEFVPPVPLKERKPIRVLALFDGIATGLVVLKQLDIELEVYYASEINDHAQLVTQVKHNSFVKQLGDIQFITEKMIHELGPFDLVMGGSPCNDLSIANPARKGIYEGTGRLFFDFFRILMYCKPPAGSARPFFWVFENVVGMRHEDKRVISRFLQCNPIMLDAKDVSAQHRARYFWGNLPGMNRPAHPLPCDKLELQDCLEPGSGRHARFNKVRTITTKPNSLKQTNEAVMPVETVKENGETDEDVLWCTEVERLFGFADHYTDVANMGRSHRQKLLGSAWSIPVMRHILAPLKDYFKCSRS